jgi:hypothetical protein
MISLLDQMLLLHWLSFELPKINKQGRSSSTTLCEDDALDMGEDMLAVRVPHDGVRVAACHLRQHVQLSLLGHSHQLLDHEVCVQVAHHVLHSVCCFQFEKMY